jgi:hypothetical protein
MAMKGCRVPYDVWVWVHSAPQVCISCWLLPLPFLAHMCALVVPVHEAPSLCVGPPCVYPHSRDTLDGDAGVQGPLRRLGVGPPGPSSAAPPPIADMCARVRTRS